MVGAVGSKSSLLFFSEHESCSLALRTTDSVDFSQASINGRMGGNTMWSNLCILLGCDVM